MLTLITKAVLIQSCRGNIVRVAEELAKIIEVPVRYSTLTRFCREHGLTPRTRKAAWK